MHYIGAVSMFIMHNIGTVPMFKMHTGMSGLEPTTLMMGTSNSKP